MRYGEAMVLLALIACAADPADPGVDTVRVRTPLGAFRLELNPDAAPVTVDNFLTYVAEGFYDGRDGRGATVVHRVVPGFVLQAGGLRADLSLKDTLAPIPNEADNGLSNARGTVAMARLTDPDSATSQWFVNLADNPGLDASDGQAGYAVFARVIEGMDVVDALAAVPTEDRDGLSDVPVQELPLERVVADPATRRGAQ